MGKTLLVNPLWAMPNRIDMGAGNYLPVVISVGLVGGQKLVLPPLDPALHSHYCHKGSIAYMQ
jgi:hypothetical protein